MDPEPLGKKMSVEVNYLLSARFFFPVIISAKNL